MTPTTVLRPIHAWFFFWERLVPSLYRVIATGLAALATAVVLAAAGLHVLLAVGVSLSVWIGLAIAQEHDERVQLPPDPEFSAALAAAIARPPLLLTIVHASGPTRARSDAPDTFELSAGSTHDHPLAGIYIQVLRCQVDGWMRLDVDDALDHCEPIEERLHQRGEHTLVQRAHEALAPAADAEAIAEALAAAYW